MDLSKLTMFRLMGRKLDWLNHRQTVLAQNIANSDTPNYQPQRMRDFTFQDAMRDTRTMAPRMTAVNHLPGTGRSEPVVMQREESREPYETAPAGNAVVLEEQMMQVADTAMDYNLVTNLYRKHIGMIKTALGSGGR